MKAYAVDPATQTIEEIDIEMKANTTYTFFKSILIDELTSLNQHTIYTDSNALSENKKAYFIGEQLVIGVALISGQNGLEENDVQIPLEDLRKLITFKVSPFHEKALQLLSKTDVNLYSPFIVEKEGEKLQLNTEWTLFTFNLADDRTKEYFLNELEKSIDAEEDTLAFMQKLSQMAMNVAK